MRDTNEHSHCHALKEGWHRVKGIKGALWGGLVLAFLVSVVSLAVLGGLFFLAANIAMPNFMEVWKANPEFYNDPTIAIPVGLMVVLAAYHLLQGLLELFVFMPMRFAMQLIPLRRAVDKEVKANYVFKFFAWKYVWRFAVLSFFIAVMVGIPGGVGAFLLCLPNMFHVAMPLMIISYIAGVLLLLLALYLAVSYLFAGQLIVDRKMNPWCAMQTSRATVNKRWFCVFGTLVWLFIVIAVSAVVFLVGLIWTVPYSFNVIAILYRDMLGIEGKDPVTLGEMK